MSTQSLSQTWSIKADPSINMPHFTHLSNPSPLSPTYNHWLLNSLLCYRWYIHITSCLLTRIPPTESRLRNEGVLPFFKHAKEVLNTLNAEAQKHGIPIPSFPDIPSDWETEAKIDNKVLRAALEPQAATLVKDLIAFTVTMVEPGSPYHWTSAVAGYSVTADVYLNLLSTATDSNSESVGMATRGMVDYTRVIGEEIARIRDEAVEGWNEEEAKKVANECCRLTQEAVAIGS